MGSCDGEGRLRDNEDKLKRSCGGVTLLPKESHRHFGKLLLRLEGRKDGNISWLLKRAVWTLSWEATSAEIHEFVSGAPIDSWEGLYRYCGEWMGLE